MKYLLVLPFLVLLFSCASRDLTQAELDANAKQASAADTERDSSNAARAAAVQRDLAKEKAIAQAAANLTPIADAVEAKGEPGIANVTRDQKRNIDSALDLPSALYPLATITLQGLLKDAEAERSKAQAKASELQQQLGQVSAQAAKAEQDRVAAEAKAEAARELAAEEKKRADAEATKAGWLQAGGIALGVLTTLGGLAARLGLPGGSLVSSLLSMATPMLTQRREVATAAVAAADVGRSALGVLDTVVASDPSIGAALAAKISQLTGGKVDSVEALFKLAAKAHTVDEGNHVDGVDKLLNEIRGKKIATAGGVPVLLSSLLKAA